MTHNFFRDASAILLVYDICNAQSFANVSGWVSDARRHASSSVTLLLVGNKSDCPSKREVQFKLTCLCVLFEAALTSKTPCDLTLVARE